VRGAPNLQILNCKGFTFIELLIVISIVGIILAVALPRFSFFDDIYVRKDIRQVTRLIRYLNEAAVTKKLYYRVKFNIERGMVKVEYSNDGVEYNDETDSFMKGLSFGDMMKIEDIILPGIGKINNGEVAVIFLPYGFSEPFNLHLKGLGKFFTLSFNPYTEKVNIEEGYV
jgi:prepilin-type N-terminal cleavage/methylation domain-containing protein